MFEKDFTCVIPLAFNATSAVMLFSVMHRLPHQDHILQMMTIGLALIFAGIVISYLALLFVIRQFNASGRLGGFGFHFGVAVVFLVVASSLTLLRADIPDLVRSVFGDPFVFLVFMLTFSGLQIGASVAYARFS